MSTITIITLIVVGLVLIFILLLYFTLFPPSKDLSRKKPYNDMIGKDLLVKREATVALNYPPYARFKPYIMVDSGGFLGDDIKPRYALKAGTPLRIQSVKQYKNGTSGEERILALGKVHVNELNTEVEFEYEVGSTSLTPNGILWNHSKPLWQ